MSNFKKGVCIAVVSYIIWGLLPLFWKLLSGVSPIQILSFRIIFSLVFVLIILTSTKNFSWLLHFKEAKKMKLILPASLLITTNWGMYIWAVNAGHAIEASLGYYMNPIISIMLGLIFFKEKLSPLQWTAFACALTGVTILTIMSGVFPWIPILLALTFGLYSLIKKKISTSSAEALASETLSAVPLAVFLLLFPFQKYFSNSSAADIFGSPDLLLGASLKTWFMLVLTGPVTAAPLLLFSKSVKMIPLSSIGFIQFISPTLMLILGIFAFHEPFPVHNIIAFGFVWLAVILYSVSLARPVR